MYEEYVTHNIGVSRDIIQRHVNLITCLLVLFQLSYIPGFAVRVYTCDSTRRMLWRAPVWLWFNVWWKLWYRIWGNGYIGCYKHRDWL